MKYFFEVEPQDLDLILGALSELPLKVSGQLHYRLFTAAKIQKESQEAANLQAMREAAKPAPRKRTAKQAAK